jgi:SET domain-containing protein
VGKYELLVEYEGCIGLGLMLGRQEIVGPGHYIGEYTGVVKVEDEKVIDEDSNYNASLIKGEYVIDAKDSSNILKYCNHSCKPNAYLDVRHSLSGEPRICMFSKKKIAPFSWINISYGKLKDIKGFFKDDVCLCNSCVNSN